MRFGLYLLTDVNRLTKIKDCNALYFCQLKIFQKKFGFRCKKEAKNSQLVSEGNVIENLQHLCQTVLEPLREFVNAPVVVSSGYRCSELNKMVGGVWNSQHLTGEAADIQPQCPIATVPASSAGGSIGGSSLPQNDTLKQWFLFILQHCRFDQLILETKGNRRWIHVSCCRDEKRNRQTCLTKKSAETVTSPCLF